MRVAVRKKIYFLRPEVLLTGIRSSRHCLVGSTVVGGLKRATCPSHSCGAPMFGATASGFWVSLVYLVAYVGNLGLAT